MTDTAVRERVLDYCRNAWGTEPDYPFPEDDVSAVLRHEDNRKWYALLMRIPADRLRLPLGGMVDIMNIKADPVMLGSLLMQKGYYPAWHMNKSQWVTVLLDGTLPMDDVAHLIDMSWRATQSKGGKKKRRTLPEQEKL